MVISAKNSFDRLLLTQYKINSMALPVKRRKVSAKNDSAARAWNRLIFEGKETKRQKRLAWKYYLAMRKGKLSSEAQENLMALAFRDAQRKFGAKQKEKAAKVKGK